MAWGDLSTQFRLRLCSHTFNLHVCRVMPVPHLLLAGRWLHDHQAQVEQKTLHQGVPGIND